MAPIKAMTERVRCLRRTTSAATALVPNRLAFAEGLREAKVRSRKKMEGRLTLAVLPEISRTTPQT